MKKKIQIYSFCPTILLLAASLCFIHDFLLKETALGKREFLKVGLRLINIQGAFPLHLKFVAPIFHPVYIITQAELETCGCAIEVAGAIGGLRKYEDGI